MNLSNAVSPLVGAVHLLAREDVAFLLVGSGNHAGALRAQATRHGLDNVHMLGRIPKLAVQTFLTRQDALVVSWARSPLYRYGISPNKIFDYMLAARPVVQGSDARNDLVSDAGCGITVAPDDAAALAEAILTLRRMPAAERQRLGASVDGAVFGGREETAFESDVVADPAVDGKEPLGASRGCEPLRASLAPSGRVAAPGGRRRRFQLNQICIIRRSPSSGGMARWKQEVSSRKPVPAGPSMIMARSAP